MTSLCKIKYVCHVSNVWRFWIVSKYCLVKLGECWLMLQGYSGCGPNSRSLTSVNKISFFMLTRVLNKSVSRKVVNSSVVPVRDTICKTPRFYWLLWFLRWNREFFDFHVGTENSLYGKFSCPVLPENSFHSFVIVFLEVLHRKLDLESLHILKLTITTVWWTPSLQIPHS